jgi:uncharacterized protein (TIGR02391 family)
MDIHDLLADAEALRASMERVMSGTTEDFAKWMSFKTCARSYNNIAQAYTQLTKDDSISVFNLDKMPGSTDSVWPVQKEIFEMTYQFLLSLLGRLKRRSLTAHVPTGFDDLLHPLIRDAAIRHYLSQDYRNAVLDAIVAVFDKIRERTSLDLDGEALCNQAFSLNNPILIFSELDTDSGRNDQRGFLDLFKGFYRGVRNPKAHSLVHDLDAIKAGQHLVLASILMRRVVDARINENALALNE